MLVLKNTSKEFNKVKIFNGLNVEFKSGLNFIVGPSGSGKSTLLKIISGMDKDFNGEVFFKGNSIKNFNKEQLSNYYYNSVGFIWQNFQLIDHLSVEDNIKMVLELTDLSTDEKESKVREILKKLAIDGLAKKSVLKLSGGQKQRVAIARALVKNPEIIIADEPTGALDKKSSSIIMGALRKISKERLVIVVTHDKSLIDDESNSFLLDKGNISQMSSGNNEKVKLRKEKEVKPKLSIVNSFSLGCKNFKGLFMKFVMTSLVLMLSSYFLLLNISGTVVNEQEKILNDLVQSKGNSLRDINVYSDVISSGSSGSTDNNKPSLDVKQDTESVANKYKDDPRVEYFISIKSLNDMVVNIDGVLKNYKVENSNSSTFVNGIVEGRMPQAGAREVAVSKTFVERANLKVEDIIGKTLSVAGVNYDWSSGNAKDVEVKAEDLTIVGVVDTTVSYTDPNYGKIEYELEDSFVYSLDVVNELGKQSNTGKEKSSFTIRVKEIKDIMPIVNELNKEGITAMGQFESVRDILTISNTTKDQVGSITVIISVIAILVTIVIVLINGLLRKREFSILKINGYEKGSIFKLNVVENLLISIVSIVLFIVSSPIINKLAVKAFSMEVNNGKSIVTGVAIILVQGIIMGLISGFITSTVKPENNIMTGDR